MIDESGVEQVVTVIKNCSKQLRWAHSDLTRVLAPVGSLTKISGVADALDGIVGQIEEAFQEAREEVAQAGRTAGGLRDKLAHMTAQKDALNSRGIDRS